MLRATEQQQEERMFLKSFLNFVRLKTESTNETLTLKHKFIRSPSYVSVSLHLKSQPKQ